MIYSDTTDRTGMIQALEDDTSTQDVSSYSTAVKTVRLNSAFDDYQKMVVRVAGTWQADDTNHTKYPNMTFDLTSGQKDYTFENDEQGNQIQDIYRVEVKTSSGSWKVLKYVNEMNYTDAISQIDGQSGEPDEYYLTANGVFLVVAPNYTQADGIRMFFTRSPNYFLASDTTKEPGIPHGHERYLIAKAAYWYWLPKDTTRAQLFWNEVMKVEENIKDEYSQRTRMEKPALRITQSSTR